MVPVEPEGRAPAELIEAAHDPVVVIDPSGRITQVNALTVHLFGYPADELLGESIDLLVPHGFPRVAPTVARDLSAVRKDGTTVPIEVNLTAFTQRTGREVLVAGIRDVRAAVELQRDLAEARDLFVSVLNGATEQSIVATDRQGRVTIFSDGAVRMTGYTAQEMLGRSPMVLHDPDELAARARELGVEPGPMVFVVPCRHGQPDVHEWTYIRADGQRIIVLLTVTPMTNAGGHLTGYICVASDLTERKRVEAELAASEQRFRLAFDNAPVGMALTSLNPDAPGQFFRVNRAACDLLGYTRTELLGTSIMELTHPDDRDGSFAAIDALMSGELLQWQVERRLKHADGHYVWVNLSTSVVMGAGEPTYAVSLLEDITVRRQTAVQLEERFEQLADNVSVGFVLHREDSMRILYANPAYLRMFGFAADELPEAAELRDRLHPDDLAAGADLFHQTKSGQHAQAELRVRPHPGETRWIRAELNPIFDDAGAVVRIAGIYEDITERRAADEALRESEQRFTQLADSMKIGVALRQLDPPAMLYANPAAKAILGIDLVHLAEIDESGTGIGMTVVHPDDADRVNEHYWQGARIGERVESEHRIIRPDGQVRWVHATSSPVTDGTGRVIRAAVTFEDISERVESQAVLQAARTEAEQANAAKDEFLSRMSHELRTPLNAVLGFAQLLQLEDLTPGQKDAVHHIMHGGKHLLAMINDVLDITGIEGNRLELSMEPVDIAELLADSIGLMQPLAEADGVEIACAHPLDVPVFVQTDRRRLRQVLLNLLSNAVKYNRRGGRVGVAVDEPGGDVVVLRVTDTGLGIDNELLPRLFSPFDRLGRQASEIEGTGIGLALSRRLVVLMGGQLDVVSTPGEGSTFTVTLPMADPPAVVPATRNAPPVATVPANRTSTVLYIEDNSSNVQLVRGILRKRPGWTLVHAGTGGEGLELARTHAPQVILLDLHLPDTDGIEVLRQLRSEPATAAVPVAVLSADANPSQVARLVAAGAQRYLTKPLDVAELLAFLDGHAR